MIMIESSPGSIDINNSRPPGNKRWDDKLAIGFMRGRLEREDEVRTVKRANTSKYNDADEPTKPETVDTSNADELLSSDPPPPAGRDAVVDPPGSHKAYGFLRNPPERPPSPSSRPEYKILRNLPGYSVGDALRKQDKVLCYCREATSYAMDKLREGDCAFIKRTDRSFTYCLYMGRNEDDQNTLIFRLDDEGHFKRLSTSKFAKLVKVPVLLGRTSSFDCRSPGTRRADVRDGVASTHVASNRRSHSTMRSQRPASLRDAQFDAHWRRAAAEGGYSRGVIRVRSQRSLRAPDRDASAAAQNDATAAAPGGRPRRRATIVQMDSTPNVVRRSRSVRVDRARDSFHSSYLSALSEIMNPADLERGLSQLKV